MQERMPVLREERKKSRSSRKLIVFLLLLFVTLLAVLFFRSPLSKVSSIEIVGNAALSAETIGQAAGIENGDNYFGFRSSTIEQRVRQLAAVESVETSKSFPGSVRITVKEYPRVAFQILPSGEREMLLSNGLAIPVRDKSIVVDKPILSGWSADDPWKLKLCETLRKIPDKTLAEISEIKPAPTRTYEDKIKMYTRSQYEVYTTVTYLPEKMLYLEEMIAQMADKDVDSGVFELLEANTHIPFEQYYAEPLEAKNGTKPDARDTSKRGD